ncbi:MAG: M15 family metallopeptidase [Rectinemataceae bacterium]|nr:M15 family metallopeptidase [Spirochaetaceae bacterium]
MIRNHAIRMPLVFMLLMCLTAGMACSAQETHGAARPSLEGSVPRQLAARISTALGVVRMSDADRTRIITAIAAHPSDFISLLDAAVALRAKDPDLLRRVDKSVSLPASYEPSDLVPLEGPFPYVVAKKGIMLRAPARDALAAMAAAARKDGITLVVSSAYRSYEYQKTVFESNVRAMGRTEAERVSAPPGMSQHQLGTAIDFGTIDDSFAETPAGRWLAAHAAEHGFSLSFPKGMEQITGYRWESWHYRYLSVPAVRLQNEFFLGVQQYLIEFLDVYR